MSHFMTRSLRHYNILAECNQDFFEKVGIMMMVRRLSQSQRYPSFPRWSDEYDFADSYSWPLLTYLISCAVYPFVSSFAHCFDCCSARAR